MLALGLTIILFYISNKSQNKHREEDKKQREQLFAQYKTQQEEQTTRLEKALEETAESGRKNAQKVKDELLKLIKETVAMVESLKKERKK